MRQPGFEPGSKALSFSPSFLLGIQKLSLLRKGFVWEALILTDWTTGASVFLSGCIEFIRGPLGTLIDGPEEIRTPDLC